MASRAFPEIKKHLGFGMMRLPMREKEVDHEQTCRMVDLFLENGFNYFDTAHGYLNGLSERAIRDCLAARHARSEYILTNKLTGEFFRTREDIRPLFQSQLEACGVDYFDFYLMHAQNAREYEAFQRRGAYEAALELKAEGKFRHFGISFHDKAAVLERILNDYPQIELVQIQFNYVDYEDVSVESRKVYEVCRKYGKPVVVMEPVKGGSLANPPEAVQQALDRLRADAGTDCSNAGYALRFAADFEGMEVVLSGMSTLDQMRDNIANMGDLKPLTDLERAAMAKVAEVYNSLEMIPCTACRYCVDENHCPKGIRIPELFACMNKKQIFHDWNMGYYYRKVLTANDGKASDCVKCGKCEKVCPQHLHIRDLLVQVAAEFETPGPHDD